MCLAGEAEGEAKLVYVRAQVQRIHLASHGHGQTAVHLLRHVSSQLRGVVHLALKSGVATQLVRAAQGHALKGGKRGEEGECVCVCKCVCVWYVLCDYVCFVRV